ncbi:Putative protein of unknown function [Podospora comata]|uniref:Rhodopsin domain-containing protein n=1 Tax=Podospora comata TaxID=48703 RepID=A0ABY6RTM6_PODCO|nr:Putative protein of unknown function [Podospora comata]
MASGNLPGENRAYQIEAPCIVFFVLAPIFVGVRLWARIKLRGWSGIGLDDWTILVSTIFATVVSALMVASCAHGFGQHIANLTKPNRLMTLKLFYVAQAFYKLTINLTKASILLLYLRIFPKLWFRKTCLVLLAVILLYMVGTTASSIWQCNPIPRAWDKSIAGTCISITANWYANAAFSITTDLVILGLPMHSIYTSHLPTSQKLALMGVFALGLFTTITSILRMTTLNFSSTSPDITFDIDSSIWTMIEQNLAIICACLPVCRLPLSYILPSYFSTSTPPSSSSSIPAIKMKPRIHIGGSSSSTQEFNGHISDAEGGYGKRRYGQYGIDKGVIETSVGVIMPPATPVTAGRLDTSGSRRTKAEEWVQQQRREHENLGRQSFHGSVHSAGRSGHSSSEEGDRQSEAAIRMVRNYGVLSDGEEVEPHAQVR